MPGKEPSPKDRVGVSELEVGGDFFNLDERVLELGPGVARRDAEAAAAQDHRRRGEADHDHGQVLREALAGELENLCRVVEKHGDDRRVVVAVHVEAHLDALAPKVVGVIFKRGELGLSEFSALHPHDDLEGRQNLLAHHRGHGRVVHRTRARHAQMVDHRLVGGDVTAHAAEGLSKRAHHDVHVRSGHAAVLGDPAAARAQRADRVGFVQVEVDAVLFADLHDSGEVADFPLHGIDALDRHHDLVPWAAGPRLTHADRISEDLFKVGGVVVLKDSDERLRGPRAVDDRGVVQSVADDEITFTHQSRDRVRVGREAHVVHDCVFLSEEVGDEPLELLVQEGGPAVQPPRADPHWPCLERAQHVGTARVLPVVREAQVVVRAQVETGRHLARLLDVHQAVRGPLPLPPHHVDRGPGRPLNRSVERLLHAVVKAPRVKVLRGKYQRRHARGRRSRRG
mmetsp:Transcript_43792/g.98999  ORF Transcript_43792/g.98999 Transcript_43792/m.98999 type:complete len:455 (-) Transcript_43792:332-1696(-)